MSYIAGNPPQSVARQAWDGAATVQGQNVIPIPGGFAPGMCDVFVGGACLSRNGSPGDFDDSSGTQIVLTQPMTLGTAYRVVVYAPGATVNNSTPYRASMTWVQPAAGATSIPFPHQLGFAWPMQRGVMMQPEDYTEDANGFYFVNQTADGVEKFAVLNITPATIADILPSRSPIIVSGGMTYADGSQQGSAAVGLNRIINGAFMVNQRQQLGIGKFYVLDRWYQYAVGAVPSGASNTNPSPYAPNSLNVVGQTGNTGLNIGQCIESVNIADLAGKQVTISGYIFQKLGNANVVFATYTPNAKDNFSANTATIGFSLGALAPQTWTRFVKTFTCPASANNGLQIEFQWGGVVSTSDWIYMSNIQLQAGTEPNPTFEKRLFTTEQMHCDRYFQLISVVLGTNITDATNQAAYTLRSMMRVNPAVTLPGGGNGAAFTAVNNNSIRAITNATAFGAGYANCDSEL